ncbi:MAG: hypothetical protein WC471_03470 [Candidatus Woesearchaeota archaeon]
MRNIIALITFILLASVCSASYQLPGEKPLTKDNNGHAIIDSMLSLKNPQSDIFIVSYFMTHCAGLARQQVMIEMTYFNAIFLNKNLEQVNPHKFNDYSLCRLRLYEATGHGSKNFSADDVFTLESFCFYIKVKHLFEVMKFLDPKISQYHDMNWKDIPREIRPYVSVYQDAGQLLQIYIRDYTRKFLLEN